MTAKSDQVHMDPLWFDSLHRIRIRIEIKAVSALFSMRIRKFTTLVLTCMVGITSAV
jgi:hypothetical protein